MSDLDNKVRLHIYRHFARTGLSPSARDTANALSISPAAARSAMHRLAEAHKLVLKDGQILMAHPFSAAPTTFQVASGKKKWWANCIWDALGIPVMLKRDAQILTSCGCCAHPMALNVNDGKLKQVDGIIHFAVPARKWWDDVVFT